jgi:uncharacterized surface protein with fasciclin (FAS1) repeats
MKKLLLGLLILTLSLSLPLSALAQDELPTIAEIAASDENFSTLLTAVEAAGLSEALSAEGELTVFAPTNAAFEALPPGMLDGLLSSPPSVQAVVSYHVLDGIYSAEDLAAAQAPIPTLMGAPLTFSSDADGNLLINGSVMVVTADIQASNGVVHVIDAVLVPQRPGEGGPEGEAGPRQGDPGSASADRMAATIMEILAERQDIELGTLIAAVGMSEPVAIALSIPSENGFTLFAPEDAAFADLDPATLEAVLADPLLLTSILLYHAVPSGLDAQSIMSELVANAGTIELETALPGATITVSANETNVLVNEAQVTRPDLIGSNGVVHVIDAVLLPPDEAILTQEAYDELVNSLRQAAASAPMGEPEAESMDLTDRSLIEILAEREGDELAFLNTAVSLSEAASIALSLPSENGMTLFAPQDAAFDELPAEVREDAIADPLLLTSILLYHTLPEGLRIEDIQAQQAGERGIIEIETALPGATITIEKGSSGQQFINGPDGARIALPNLLGSNGVLHIIDAVLIPPAEFILTQEAYDELINSLRQAAATSMGNPDGETVASSSGMSEGPALDANWAAVAGGFGMAELDSADDFFVDVIDPFAEGEAAQLYGIEIINWTADYQYTGFIVERFLPAEVLIWMAEQDPSVWEGISESVLALLPAEELAKLPEDVQARAQ